MGDVKNHGDGEPAIIERKRGRGKTNEGLNGIIMRVPVEKKPLRGKKGKIGRGKFEITSMEGGRDKGEEEYFWDGTSFAGDAHWKRGLIRNREVWAPKLYDLVTRRLRRRKEGWTRHGFKRQGRIAELVA